MNRFISFAFSFKLLPYIQGKGAAAPGDGDDVNGDGDGGREDGDGAAASSSTAPAAHNPEFDVDPKIQAGLDRIKRLDKTLSSKAAEAAIVRREVYPGKYFDPVTGTEAQARQKVGWCRLYR
jgi:hypothetical protein